LLYLSTHKKKHPQAMQDQKEIEENPDEMEK